MVQEVWEEQSSPFCSLVVQEMHERIDRVTPIIQEHMEASQQDQQRVYNW